MARLRNFVFFLSLLHPFASRCYAAQTSLPSVSVTIQQIHDVLQGQTGSFDVRITPVPKPQPIMLRLTCDLGTGRAVFEDGSTEKVLTGSATVSVRGVISSDLPGALTLTAWPDGAQTPAATAFFNVLAANPAPRIFFEGFDVTGTHQSVVVGQQIQLTVTLHPSLPVQNQEWTIGTPGDYTGGFVHAPLHGGAQPVVREGSTTTFYWVTPGYDRRVVYRLQLANGTMATADVTFDVEGPAATHVEVDSAKVVITPGAANSSVLGIMGTGISFHARYFPPEGMMKNFIWVQLIRSDSIAVNQNGVRLHCVPKSEPIAGIGAGLDTDFPYDTHNPTFDNPRIQLSSDVQSYSRLFRARMYLLWKSGVPNSIAVPLGFVDWSFSGEVVLKDAQTNSWVLKSGQGGPNNPAEPFMRSHSYPLWNSLVPYTEVLTCN
jgi:hypothetical protein